MCDISSQKLDRIKTEPNIHSGPLSSDLQQSYSAEDSKVEVADHVTKVENGSQPSASTATTTVNDTITASTSTSTIINKTDPQPSTSTISINIKTEPLLNAGIAATTTVPTTQVNSDDTTKIDYSVPDKSRGSFYCKLCDKHTYKEKDWGLHINGKMHKMKVNAGPIDALVGSNFEYVDVEAKLMTQLKDHESAIVGLDFITEKQFMSEPPTYECHLCAGKLGEPQIIPHITSFKHRYSYVRKVDPDWLKADSDGPSARVETIADKTASLEKQFGQGKIVVKIQKSNLSAVQKLKNVGLSMKEFIAERNQSQAVYDSKNTPVDTIRPGFNEEHLRDVLLHNPTSKYAPKPPMKPMKGKNKKRPAPFVDGSDFSSEAGYSAKRRKKQRCRKFPPQKKNKSRGPSQKKNKSRGRTHW